MISAGARLAAVERSGLGGPASGVTFPDGSDWYYEFRRPRYVGMDGPLPAGAERLLTLGKYLLARHLLDRPVAAEVMTAVVPRLWLLASPKPLGLTTPNNWRRLWEMAGYCREGLPEERPTRPMRLYRGGSSDGWSWTPDADVALGFASGFKADSDVSANPLWTVLAPPEALLGWVPLACEETTGRTDVEECVVYPGLLPEIEQVTGPDLDRIPRLHSDTRNGRFRIHW